MVIVTLADQTRVIEVEADHIRQVHTHTASPLARATSEAPAKVDAMPSIACRFHAAIIV